MISSPSLASFENTVYLLHTIYMLIGFCLLERELTEYALQCICIVFRFENQVLEALRRFKPFRPNSSSNPSIFRGFKSYNNQVTSFVHPFVRSFIRSFVRSFVYLQGLQIIQQPRMVIRSFMTLRWMPLPIIFSRVHATL